MKHPKKLTAQLIERLAEAVGDGLPDVKAAPLVGISSRTLKNWRAAGKTAHPRSLLARLDRELARADAGFLAYHAKALRQCDKPGLWQKHAWFLERRAPDHFALVQKTEIGQPGDFAKLSPKELDAKILELVDRAPKAGEVRAGAVATLKPKAGG